MSYLIKDLPLEERPRERLKKVGVENLSNEELLSIILRTGTKSKSVKDLSIEILKEHNLNELKNLNYNSLKKIKGIGETKALTLLASLELSKRILYTPNNSEYIKTTKDLYNNLKLDLKDKLQEKFMAIYVDNKLKMISKKVLFIGTLNESHVSPRDLFREAVKENAYGIFIAHNHPSGNIAPSKEDIRLTEVLIKIGTYLQIPVIDHIIIGDNNYYSFRDERSDLFA